MTDPIVQIDNLTYRYGERRAVDGLTLAVEPGEIFGFLGPNGSGKTTLFRVLSTLAPVAPGHVKLFGLDAATQRDAIRSHLGVVFQSPSLDKQLTAAENLMHHGHLYGLVGAELQARIAASLDAVSLGPRASDRVEKFSGGMRRRVEVAKALLHRPRLLLLDEPSTGLDPAARIEMWKHLRQINADQGVTVMMTTHLMEEADRCTRLAVMAEGKLQACDTPAALKARIGGDIVTLTTARPVDLRAALADRLGIEAHEIDGSLRIERPRAHELVPQLIEAAPGLVDSVSVGKPTLEDVFIHLTGRKLSEDEDAPLPLHG